MGHHLYRRDRDAARRASAAGGGGPSRAGGPRTGGRRHPRLRLAAAGRRVGPDRRVGTVQLRPVLPPAHRRRLPAPRRGRRGGRRPAAAAGRHRVVAGHRAPAQGPGPGRRARRGPRRRPGRDPPRRGPRPRRRPRRRRRQRVVRGRSRAHPAPPCPGAGPPAGGHRVAAPAGRRDARPARLGRRGPAPRTDRRQRRRVRLPEPGRHRPGLPPVVRRHPPPPGRRAAAPRPGRAGHRRAAGLGDPPPVAVAGPARRLRAHPRRHRLRGIAGRLGRGGR